MYPLHIYFNKYFCNDTLFSCLHLYFFTLEHKTQPMVKITHTDIYEGHKIKVTPVNTIQFNSTAYCSLHNLLVVQSKNKIEERDELMLDCWMSLHYFERVMHNKLAALFIYCM